ncbi:MAG: hypothetical protein QCI38_09190, partial [Candidatus Thermoplasmatota archaeon]|nr:hypothetical protein [Candidatus Thermoplasmatota archaeon]
FYHWGFNDSLADEGYNVTIYAGDGYNQTFTITQIARNDSIVVSYILNGERLSGNSWPLRLVGPTLSGAQRIRNIARIAIVDAQ